MDAPQGQHAISVSDSLDGSSQPHAWDQDSTSKGEGPSSPSRAPEASRVALQSAGIDDGADDSDGWQPCRKPRGPPPAKPPNAESLLAGKGTRRQRQKQKIAEAELTEARKGKLAGHEARGVPSSEVMKTDSALKKPEISHFSGSAEGLASSWKEKPTALRNDVPRMAVGEQLLASVRAAKLASQTATIPDSLPLQGDPGSQIPTESSVQPSNPLSSGPLSLPSCAAVGENGRYPWP